MNKAIPVKFQTGDEVSYSVASGVAYGTVLRVLGDGDTAAVEIEFENGRKEIKRVKDRALSLLRRASGASEVQEHRTGAGAERLRDFDVE
ncbi:MAG TPA: hypothetical protein VI756_31425, partial [Blastocatellia bacterium]